MKVDVIISADHINEESLEGKTVVVIDMLRATSVITTALANGAKKVIPLLTVEEAFDMKEELKSLGESVLLGGERRALKIEGFDCTNSPLEYTSDVVKNNNVVITTTNGTRAITLSLKADEILVGAMINAKAIVDKVKDINKDVVFINAGTNGEFSMDDFICSGYMIYLLSKDKEHDLTDIAKTAKLIYKSNENIIDYIKDARHYNILKTLGLEADLNYCCQKDIIKSVPRYDKNKKSIVI
ncbi:2-phosphosulfolactate phosphatase family protein [Clostridium chauvoei]|uniref:Probable 2-phosphosulfolactate phosphatase n=2 Tax=Clostridium chauvoei TaxID=46867 RepID=S6ENK5_9CLOT|nr:2-phosphosulfolactate phosphatase family protein [Clostridium chauvoei]ATD53810.1 2-phosphosulfolactate phosphatase [Clostridium chauvoei]ATD58383.1 2-phosphosulfolactate phosphatase [Clostridium chauvoei]MBX7280432.1 2-phosphosulfolactate phosphatase family protein [Clostridium chauvoei]MBX7282917.1 2-phosphosulfolactate phosphatase family protein [Clostridium chauvoei]MBX7285323.1 2-phosphosulfolactate phosphatase family protein [Clostridium chauvoei]